MSAGVRPFISKQTFVKADEDRSESLSYSKWADNIVIFVCDKNNLRMNMKGFLTFFLDCISIDFYFLCVRLSIDSEENPTALQSAVLQH